jgi:hypothetical protein
LTEVIPRVVSAVALSVRSLVITTVPVGGTTVLSWRTVKLRQPGERVKAYGTDAPAGKAWRPDVGIPATPPRIMTERR